jgi:hypothetical protein
MKQFSGLFWILASCIKWTSFTNYTRTVHCSLVPYGLPMTLVFLPRQRVKLGKLQNSRKKATKKNMWQTLLLLSTCKNKWHRERNFQFDVFREVLLYHLSVISIINRMYVLYHPFTESCSEQQFLAYYILYSLPFSYSTANFNHKMHDFWTVGQFRQILIIFIFLFSPPWRWLPEWSKHVGDHCAIKLHQ